ncbi:hypothetical protein D3C81_1564700 [compost metagenome]
MGFGHAHGVGNFAQARGTQLDHRSGMFRRQFEQGQRNAEVIIQVATGRQHCTARAQDARKHFLDRGLAAGTGNGCNGLGERGAVQRTELPQRLTGVADQQLRQRAVGDFTLDQRGHGALGGDFIQIIMTIEARTGQRDKQLTGLDCATVDADTVETGIGRDQARIQSSGQLAQFQGLKHGPPPTRSRHDRPRPDRKRHDARR